MRPAIYAIVIVVMILSSCAGVRHSSEITPGELSAHVKYLASEKLEGRLPGSEGDLMAEKYIRRELAKAGLAPFTGDGIQRFEVPFSAEAGPSNRLTVNGHSFITGADFVPLSLSSNDSLTAGVVFAGYGFVADNDSMKWNDYSGFDIKGKWVMLLRGYPEPNPKASYYRSLSADRTKVITAGDKGAAGVLLVSGEAWDPSDILDRPARGVSSSGMPVIQIKRSVADSILAGTGMVLGELESEINTKLISVSLNTQSTVSAETEVISKNVMTGNVAMKLAGSTDAEEYVIVGAHFDHLGMGGPGSSSRAVDTIAVHHGADDNASGVALMIELAGKLADKRDEIDRSIIFVAFAAEEMGLLGSKYFVENMGIKPGSVNLMVNLDMVGRMKEGNGLQVGGVGTASGLRDSVISVNKQGKLSLAFTDEGYGPSDHSSFYGKDIPVLFLTTGAHLDYHTPADTWDKINYEGMTMAGELLYDIVKSNAAGKERLAFTEAGPKAPSQPMGRRRGVTLGIMPDFAGNVKNGLRADFVTPGRPAAAGGMKKGDIITAIDNKPVNNIEEYMFRLNQLKHGQTITVDVLRDGKHEVLLIQL